MIPINDLQAQYYDIYPEIEYDIVQILRSCDYVGGAFLDRFENALANYLQIPTVTGVSSGTDAVILACEILNLNKKGVIIPNNASIGAAFGISRSGARLLIIDVDPNTYLLNLNQVEDLLKARKSNKAKAIYAPNLYGQMPHMEELHDLAKKYGVYFIEDASHSMGATHKNFGVGTYSDLFLASLGPNRSLSSVGQAGVIGTRNQTMSKAIKAITNQEKINCIGGNFKLDNIMAAQLFHCIRKLDHWNERKRSIARIYNEEFPSGRRPVQQPNSKHIYHKYQFKCSDIDERNLMEFVFKKEKINYELNNNLISDWPIYGEVNTPVANDLKRRLISLPLFTSMTVSEVEYVIEIIKSFVNNYK